MESQKQTVGHIWRSLVARGFMYKNTCERYYATTDECFYAPSRTSAHPAASNIVTATETGPLRNAFAHSLQPRRPPKEWLTRHNPHIIRNLEMELKICRYLCRTRGSCGALAFQTIRRRRCMCGFTRCWCASVESDTQSQGMHGLRTCNQSDRT